MVALGSITLIDIGDAECECNGSNDGVNDAGEGVANATGDGVNESGNGDVKGVNGAGDDVSGANVDVKGDCNGDEIGVAGVSNCIGVTLLLNGLITSGSITDDWMLFEIVCRNSFLGNGNEFFLAIWLDDWPFGPDWLELPFEDDVELNLNIFLFENAPIECRCW